jgi:predicted component of type VI protein secretion system
MVVLRLFHRNQPDREIGSRRLAEGGISIGRDAHADWAVPDPTHTLSRLHCIVACEDGRLALLDHSSNGVTVDGVRLPRGGSATLAPGQTIALGDFLLRVEAEDDNPWLAAFCAGAGIDPAAFAGADPAETLRRLGARMRELEEQARRSAA